MAIENRNLLAGTRLVANYKKQTYVCKIEAGEDGEGVAFVLEDGTRHKSPSAAGSKVMGGKAVNGWRFWTLEGDEPKAEAKKPETAEPKAKARSRKLIWRMPNQGGLAEGKTRFWCNACMKSFVTDEAQPAACPEGHSPEALAAFAADELTDAVAEAGRSLEAGSEKEPDADRA